MSVYTPFAYYGGELWFPVTASGGQIVIDSSSWDGCGCEGPYAYHVFTASGQFTVTDTGSDGYVEMFLVGGGGGGKSGGGGGGGIYQEYQYTVVSGSLDIVIGAGGSGGTGDTANNTSGSASTISGSGFLYAIALGGGKGAPNNTLDNTVTSQGGSGGGGGAGGVNQINLGGNSISGSLGTYQTKHGSPGGNAISGSSPIFAPAGGGGFSTTGIVNIINSQGAGYGGDGSFFGNGNVYSYWFGYIDTGSLGYSLGDPGGWFAGGGGGRRSDAQPTLQGIGGNGGGGNGNTGSSAGESGTPNTGGGGGGAAAGGQPGQGGSGICIVRYRLTNNPFNPFIP